MLVRLAGVTIHSEHPFVDPEGVRDPARRLRGRLGGTVCLVTGGAGTTRAGLTVSSVMVGHGDPAHVLARQFGVLIEDEGLALRGTFVINPDGVIKTAEVHDNAIARDIKETLRKLQAAQYVAKNPGEVCPAKWQEGAKTIAPSLDLVGKI